MGATLRHTRDDALGRIALVFAPVVPVVIFIAANVALTWPLEVYAGPIK